MDSETSHLGESKAEASVEQLRACPACGDVARREEARFCATCGRSLDQGYLPADALRSSYHLQHRPVTGKGRRSKGGAAAQGKNQMASTFAPSGQNNAATIALAFMTYSLVPYLGILFSPGAVLLGTFGLVYSFRAPHRAGRRAAYASLAFGLLILGVQILLWWVIIKVPEWSKP